MCPREWATRHVPVRRAGRGKIARFGGNDDPVTVRGFHQSRGGCAVPFTSPSRLPAQPRRSALEASLPDPSGSLGSSPYADPSEIEHPLTPLSQIAASRLAWVQPRLMHPAYELWGRESVAATLRFRDLSRREALAASADGIWNFTEASTEETGVLISAPGGPVGQVRVTPRGDGALLLRNERTLRWNQLALWQCTFAFVDEAGNELVRFETGDDGSSRTMVAFSPVAVLDADAPLLAITGKYLTLASGRTRQGRVAPGPAT